MNVNLYSCTYFSQGSAVTDLRGDGSFNSSFFYSSLPNFSEKNYKDWSIFAKVIVKIEVVFEIWLVGGLMALSAQIGYIMP